MREPLGPTCYSGSSVPGIQLKVWVPPLKSKPQSSRCRPPPGTRRPLEPIQGLNLCAAGHDPRPRHRMPASATQLGRIPPMVNFAQRARLLIHASLRLPLSSLPCRFPHRSHHHLAPLTQTYVTLACPPRPLLLIIRMQPSAHTSCAERGRTHLVFRHDAYLLECQRPR